MDDGDADMLKIYDGLRKGPELAHLPRVCREPMPGTKAERARFLARIAREKHAPLFVIGLCLLLTIHVERARRAASAPATLA